jgi:hypothetical protein
MTEITITPGGARLPDVITTIGTLSGGAGSWGACRRWIDEHGPDGMVLIFTDVGGSDPDARAKGFTGEHPDTLRFLAEARADLDVPLVTIREGRDIWQVFSDRKWLGNSSLAHCSWELKTKPGREWIEANAPDAEHVLVGIDMTEIERLEEIAKAWLPYKAIAPLAERPYWWKPYLLDMLTERGIKPPVMYEQGFGHANCLTCVKGGHSHWRRVLALYPETFAYAETREREKRAELGDVAILKDRSGGGARPMTLAEFRKRMQDTGGQLSLEDAFDEGGCGCFLESAPEDSDVKREVAPGWSPDGRHRPDAPSSSAGAS